MSDRIRDDLQAALGPTMTLGRELGGGGMSRVFMARDATLGRDVVVKLLSPELAQELSTERFGREIALAAALQHANIVPVLSAGVTADGLPFYLMPFIEGASLRDLVGNGKTLPIADVLLVLGDTVRALTYAHSRGVVHRDIKPDNVMLSGGAALVTDFGIAKAMSSSRTTGASTTDSLTRMGTSLGTPAYMAPEQGAGDPDTDHRADLYALGAMAYELLVGQPPFGQRAPHAQLIAHLSEAPVPVSQMRPDTPAPLAQLVMWCLEKDPARRPQQASQLTELLTDAAISNRSTTTTDAVRSTSLATAPEKTGRLSARAVDVAVALLAIVTAVAFWFGKQSPRARNGPDRSLVAIMPFTVRDASLDVWREGMVDILARSLDGAGTLRTVAPSTSIAKSTGRGDVTSASALGATVGAGLVVFGEISPMGRDSVRARVALVDVAANKVQHNLDVTGEASRIDALADSISLQLLRALGSDGLTGGARLSSLGTSSLSALKSYLVGQQYYRRGVMDSTLMSFESAVATDSLFALAWRGVASVYIRTGRENLPEARAALDRAIRLRRAGSPRDSLLLLGDSLRLAVGRREAAPNDPVAEVPEVQALIATLTEATRRYASDAELWMELGDAGFHFGYLVDRADSVVLRDFERSIALDSMMLVPVIHAQSLAIRTGRYADGAKYARRMAALMPPQASPYYLLLASVIDSAPRVSTAAKAQLDTSAAAYVAQVLTEAGRAPELTPLSLSIAAPQLERLKKTPTLADGAAFLRVLTLLQASAGLPIGSPEALTIADRAQLAGAGLIAAEPVIAEATSYLSRQPAALSGMLQVYATHRDTSALRLLVHAFDSVDVATRAAGTPALAHRGAAARAYLALAQGDSAAALRTFLSIPMAMCGVAPCAPVATARLLAAAGRDAEAARVIDRAWITLSQAVSAPKAALLRGEMAERANDRPTARMWYARAIAQWETGGDAVRPTVQAAREGLKRVQ